MTDTPLGKLIEEYRSDLDWSPYRHSFVWAARSYLLIALPLANFVTITLLFSIELVWVNIPWPMIFAALAVCSSLYFFFSRRARQHYANMALDKLLKDHRRPLLYLRKFDIDDASALSQLVAEGDSWRTEEALAENLSPYGPVVALGRHGESLPNTGALRLYVSDAAWQDCVTELIDAAEVIVFRVSSAESLRWELQQIRQRGHIRKTVFMLVNFLDKPMAYLDFEKLRDFLESEAGIARSGTEFELSDSDVSLWFAYLDLHGEVQLVTSNGSDPTNGIIETGVSMALNDILGQKRLRHLRRQSQRFWSLWEIEFLSLRFFNIAFVFGLIALFILEPSLIGPGFEFE